MNAKEETIKFLNDNWERFEYSGCFGESDYSIDVDNLCIVKYPACECCDWDGNCNKEEYDECTIHYPFTILDNGNVSIDNTDNGVSKEDFVEHWKELINQ